MTEHDPWEMTYEDEVLTDERLVYELLCGADVRLPNKQLGKAYPEPGSQRERVSRSALAQLIRKGSAFPELIRETLAGLFDPASATVPVERRIEFIGVHAGEREQRVEATLEIALHVWFRRRLGDPMDAAVQSAMTQFDLGRSRVYEIYGKHKAAGHLGSPVE